jgi:uncharacterized membrane protein
MKTEDRIEIDAPPSVVWDVFTDVERWPSWTASVTSLEALDGAGLEVGKRFRIKQPRFPRLTWVVTSISAGTSWTWESRTPGNTTAASHWVEPLDGGARTLVRQQIDARGLGGIVVGVLLRRITRRYLRLEAEGLKAASEQRARAATA